MTRWLASGKWRDGRLCRDLSCFGPVIQNLSNLLQAMVESGFKWDGRVRVGIAHIIPVIHRGRVLIRVILRCADQQGAGSGVSQIGGIAKFNAGIGIRAIEYGIQATREEGGENGSRDEFLFEIEIGDVAIDYVVHDGRGVLAGFKSNRFGAHG